MFEKLGQTVRGVSVGLKLSGTLVLVVLLTTGVMSVMQDYLTAGYLDVHGSNLLTEELSVLKANLESVLTENPDPNGALDAALARMPGPSFENQLVFGLTSAGKLILPTAWPGGLLPDQHTRQLLISRGQGLHQLDSGGQRLWIAYERLSDGSMVAAVQASREAVLGEVLTSMRGTLLLSALLLCVAVAVMAVLLSRVVLVSPLRRLTAEAERVASGDLEPPRPLRRRLDELGRLSVALNRMALTAQQMVSEAEASQARFEQLFRENRDAIFMINDQGRIEDVNPAAVKIYGHSGADSMRAMPSTESLFGNPDERRYYLDILAEQGFVKDFPVTMKRLDGSCFEALVTATLKGKKARFGIVRDVTQMRKAQRALMENEERQRRLMENAPYIIYRWSIEKEAYEYISPAVRNITGLEPGQVMQDYKTFQRCLHPAWRGRAMANWEKLLSGEGPDYLEQEYRIIHRAGDIRWVTERSMLMRASDGRPIALEGFVTDITGQKQVELELVQGREMVEATLRGLPAAVMVINRDHKIEHWNRAMENLTGIPAEQRVGTDLQWNPFYESPRPVLGDLIVDMDWDAVSKQYGNSGLKRSLLIGGGVECEGFFPNLGGRDRHMYFLAAPILDKDYRVVRVVETLVDFSDKTELEQELRRLSVTDDLTGLFNQRSFYETLAREVEAARRYGHSLSLLLLDIDHFKEYNDRFGHLEGDKVLEACAGAVKNQVRTTDLACRYGGEEFVLLMPYTSLSEALVAAGRIRVSVESLRFKPQAPGGEGEEGKVTICVGAAIFDSTMNMHDLVRQADQAMYFAKSQGRNRVAVQLPGGEMKIHV